jgi:hypothetical protein
MRELPSAPPLSSDDENVVAYLVLLEHFILLQSLHGVDLASIGFLHEPDFSESAFTNDFDGSEVLESNSRPSESEVAACQE